MTFSPEAFEALRTIGMTRAWEGLGGSHTLVTYPPLDALSALHPDTILPALHDVRRLHLYVHVPFCEMSCAFCPYETHVISGSNGTMNNYLRALKQEMEIIGNNLQMSLVQSLYVGGGTATVLSESQLEELLNGLRNHFAFSPDTLICVETSPNALIQSPAKIDLLKALGVKRVSVGVQTFSDRVLRQEGRTHTPDETLAILERLIQEIDTVNIDLMQDMHGQNDDDLEEDASHIARLRPAQVTWYVERLRKRHGCFPDAYRSVARRLWLRDRMKKYSYQPRPGGRFVRSGSGDDAFKNIRCALSSHLVGLGASAYSHVPDYFYRNIVNTAEYINAALNRNVPIAAGRALRKLDVLAAGLASGIRWGVGLSKTAPGLDTYLKEAKRRLDILIRHGLVQFDAATQEYRITVDGLGWAYEEEICSLFVPDDIVDQIRARNLPWWFNSAQERRIAELHTLQ